MQERPKPWILRASTHWTPFRSVPLKRLWVLIAAVFLLFSVMGFHADLVMADASLPYAVVLAIAVCSGLDAVLWMFVVARMSRLALFILIVAQFFFGPFTNWLANWMTDSFHLQRP